VRHALICLAWGWRRRAAVIEKTRSRYLPYSEALGEANGFARGLRFCATAALKAIARHDRRTGGPLRFCAAAALKAISRRDRGRP
jgi:hypothetical protein